jgi:imidazolonepropionase-like amidohydrolase
MGRIFFRRANLIDGRNTPSKNATVVVEDERITAVAANGDAPKPSAKDVVYDLAGRSLMPGMVQCHYHAAYSNCEKIEDIDLRYPATMLAVIAAKNAESLLRSGFTGAVGAGTLHNIDTTLKRAIDEGIIQGPRLLPCGREFVTTGDSADVHPSWWKLQLEGGISICDGPDELRKAVRNEIKAGAEMIKLGVTGGHGLAFPADIMAMTLDEMKAAADTAHGRGKKIRGHIVSKRGIMAALELGFDLIDHCDIMDEECIDRLAKQGTFVTPSLYFSYVMAEEQRRIGKGENRDGELQRWLEYSYRMIPKAHAAGVKLLIGDDFGVGPLRHGDYAKELEVYVKGAGVPALDVIGWATRNGAELLGMKDDLGTIEAGKLADLLVINGDPVRDITVLQNRANLDVVMKGGRFIECQLTPARAIARSA